MMSWLLAIRPSPPMPVIASCLAIKTSSVPKFVKVVPPKVKVGLPKLAAIIIFSELSIVVNPNEKVPPDISILTIPKESPDELKPAIKSDSFAGLELMFLSSEDKKLIGIINKTYLLSPKLKSD